MKPRNARFQVMSPASEAVTITLKPGQTLHHHSFSVDDEGSSSYWHIWTYPAGSVHVTHESGMMGSDCDGRHSSHHESFCYIDQLTARHPEGMPTDSGKGWPDWKLENSETRDHTAESAGY